MPQSDANGDCPFDWSSDDGYRVPRTHSHPCSVYTPARNVLLQVGMAISALSLIVSFLVMLLARRRKTEGKVARLMTLGPLIPCMTLCEFYLLSTGVVSSNPGLMVVRLFECTAFEAWSYYLFGMLWDLAYAFSHDKHVYAWRGLVSLIFLEWITLAATSVFPTISVQEHLTFLTFLPVSSILGIWVSWAVHRAHTTLSVTPAPSLVVVTATSKLRVLRIFVCSVTLPFNIMGMFVPFVSIFSSYIWILHFVFFVHLDPPILMRSSSSQRVNVIVMVKAPSSSNVISTVTTPPQRMTIRIGNWQSA